MKKSAARQNSFLINWEQMMPFPSTYCMLTCLSLKSPVTQNIYTSGGHPKQEDIRFAKHIVTQIEWYVELSQASST